MPLTFAPRPTSPLHLSPAPADPKDVLCPGSDCSSSEQEEDQDGLSKKRRQRIEELARGYLVGRGLWIQTAALRGPLEGAGSGRWRNPWAKKRIRRGDVVEQGGKRGVEGMEGGRGKGEVEVLESVAKRRRVGDRNGGSLWGGSSGDEGVLEGRVDGDKDRGDGVGVLGGQDPLREGMRGDAASRRVGRSPQLRSGREPVRNGVSKRVERQLFVSSDRSDAGSEPKVARREPVQSELLRDSSPSKSRGKQKQSDNLRRVQEEEAGLVGTHDKEVSSMRKSPNIPTRVLAPYVSALTDQASSSKLAARQTNHSPRPSPHTVTPSTNSPKLQHRHAKNNSVAASDKSSALFVDAPEEVVKRERSATSSSTSSSGSSAFAAALTAAQSNSESATRASLPSSSSKINPEVKRSPFAMSGQPRTSRPSSRSGSAYIDPALLSKSTLEDKSDSKPPLLFKESTKSSGKSPWISKSSSNLGSKRSTNGNLSRESLQDGQIVSGGALPTAPSGPSTNLETEKQSPRLPVMEDDDSYLKLSTQAAALKAQRSFIDEYAALPPDSRLSRLPPPTTAEPSTVTKVPAHTHSRMHRPMNTLRRSSFIKSNPLPSEPVKTPTTPATVNAITPLTITAIKISKQSPPSSKKRASFAFSPTVSTHTTTHHQPKSTPPKEVKEDDHQPSSLPSPLSPGPPPAPAHSYQFNRSMSTSPSSSHSHPPPPPPQQQQRRPSSGAAAPTKIPSSSSGLVSGRTSFSALPNISASFLGSSEWAQQDGQVIGRSAAALPTPSDIAPAPSFPEAGGGQWIDDEDEGDSDSANVDLALNTHGYSFPSPTAAKAGAELTRRPSTSSFSRTGPATTTHSESHAARVTDPPPAAIRERDGGTPAREGEAGVRDRNDWFRSPQNSQRKVRERVGQGELDAAVEGAWEFLGVGEGWDVEAEAREGAGLKVKGVGRR